MGERGCPGTASKTQAEEKCQHGRVWAFSPCPNLTPDRACPRGHLLGSKRDSFSLPAGRGIRTGVSDVALCSDCSTDAQDGQGGSGSLTSALQNPRPQRAPLQSTFTTAVELSSFTSRRLLAVHFRVQCQKLEKARSIAFSCL